MRGRQAQAGRYPTPRPLHRQAHESHTPRALHNTFSDLNLHGAEPEHHHHDAISYRRNHLPPLPDPTGGLTREEHAAQREAYLDSLGPLDVLLAPFAPGPHMPTQLPSFSSVLERAGLESARGERARKRARHASEDMPHEPLDALATYNMPHGRRPSVMRRFGTGGGWDQPWYLVEDATSRQPPYTPFLHTVANPGTMQPPRTSHLLERVQSIPSGLLELLAESQHVQEHETRVMLPPYLYRLRVPCDQCRIYGKADCFFHDVPTDRGRVVGVGGKCLECLAKGRECSLPDVLCHNNAPGEEQLRSHPYAAVTVRQR